MTKTRKNAVELCASSCAVSREVASGGRIEWRGKTLAKWNNVEKGLKRLETWLLEHWWGECAGELWSSGEV